MQEMFESEGFDLDLDDFKKDMTPEEMMAKLNSVYPANLILDDRVLLLTEVKHLRAMKMKKNKSCFYYFFPPNFSFKSLSILSASDSAVSPGIAVKLSISSRKLLMAAL